MSRLPVPMNRAPKRRGPVVTVVGKREGLDLASATPSPVMRHAARIWRTMKTVTAAAMVLAGIAAYPAWMWSHHQVDTTPVDRSEIDRWAAPEAAVAVTLIAREVEGVGWTGDKPAWSPAHQLTAQPAWQAGLATALADFAQLAAVLDPEAPADPDLTAASRLLRPSADEAMTPRLVAAAEAFARYNGRATRGAANTIDSPAELEQLLNLMAVWAEDSHAALARRVGQTDAWPAANGDVRVFYEARARAQVADSLLSGILHATPELSERASLRAQVREVERVWRQVAAQSPLMVSNQHGDGLFLPNHLAAMAWHLDRAEEETLRLADMAIGNAPNAAIASTERIILTSAP